MNKTFQAFALIPLFVYFWSFLPNMALGCTNFIVTKGASKDGSVMITYAADSHTRYGYLFHYPASKHLAGEMVSIYHYENGKHLGDIPEVEQTYNVVGFMNEYQVSVGETTWGGLGELQTQSQGLLDYGSLMKLALQRSKSAREAIKIMTELVEKYGYASTGETFSVSDKEEAWIMEIIGKGNYEKGAVWVALKIPDGYVSGHANQARITRFPFQKKNDWKNTHQEVYHSADVIQFAKEHGFYSGSEADFSFSDVYNPLSFDGARFCDARVWSFFRRVCHEVKNNPYFSEYALGKIRHESMFFAGGLNPHGFPSHRLPLWVKPDNKISLSDLMDFMRDHYEGTEMDMSNGIGAGPWNCPYRWRPMEFEVDSTLFLHERATATQQTGYSFIAQSRSKFPDLIGGILWFGVDDADACVYAPMYSAIAKIPSSYAKGNGSMIEWSDSSAFWAFNLVSNWSYSRYSVIHPEIREKQKIYEAKFQKEVDILDSIALIVYQQNPNKVNEMLTNFSVFTGNELVKNWKAFFHYLFMKYMDGNVKQTSEGILLDNGNGQGIPKKPTHPGYGNAWNRMMILNSGNGYKVIKDTENK